MVSMMGVAAVTGLSGEGKAGAANTYIQDPTKKIATEAKHYAAYGFGGRCTHKKACTGSTAAAVEWPTSLN